MANRFDVVIVPDFLGERSYIYEVRALFFLASWLENAGKARDLPLHIACIGEPPPSVRSLASRCGAMITIHPAYETGGFRFFNKLRGLEIQGQEECVLLLDVDTIVCGDISMLGDLGPCIAAVPRGLPGISESLWDQIYKALEMAPPNDRIASLVGELDIPLPKRSDPSGQFTAYQAMTPCYNGGVIFAPWNCGLRDLWEGHLLNLSRRFDVDTPIGRAVTKDDQHCLATAIETIKRRGVPFRFLPREYNADLTYIYRGTVQPNELKIIHAIGLFASLGQNGNGIRPEVLSFLGTELRSITRDLLREDLKSGQRARIARSVFPSVRKAAWLGLMLEKLYRKQVRPLLNESN